MRVLFGVFLASLLILQIACDRKESSKTQPAVSSGAAGNNAPPSATPELAPEARILGSWIADSRIVQFDFYKDGTVSTTNAQHREVANYRFADPDHIRMDSPTGSVLFQVTINGDRMTLNEPGTTVSLHRAAPGERIVDPRVAAAKAELANLVTALDTFEVDNGRYPTNDEGLMALSNQPSNMSTWHGPYVGKPIVNDPWGRPYIYRYPGTHNPRGFDLFSMGKEGKESNDNIRNWQ